MKFLVVDDSDTMRRIVINCLSREGYTEFVEASDGEEALDRFDADVGCIITDWRMPRMDGLELVRSIRSRPAGANTPVLMVTSRNSKTHILTAIRCGIDDYIIKPFNAQLFASKVEAIVGREEAA